MLKFVAFSLLILMIIKLEFVFRFEFCLNIYQKFCTIKLYLFSFKVFGASITYEKGQQSLGKLTLRMGKREMEIKLLRDGKENKNTVSAAAISGLLSNLLITELGINAKIGDKDALRATMLMGSTKIFYYSVVSFLKSKQNLKIYESFTPYYNEDVFMIDVYGILNISIADIIFSLIINGLGKLRRDRLKRREQNYDSRTRRTPYRKDNG